MSDDTIYKRLIERYRTWLFGMPDSEDLIFMLKLRFSTQEAEFLAKLPFMPHTLEQLVDKIGVTEAELKTTLAPLLKKGLVMEVKGRTAVRYSLTDSIFIFYRMPGWKGETDEINRKLAPLANRYYIRYMGADFMGHPTKALRAIPISDTIRDTRTILPYEDILYYVEQEDYHTVSTCACRHRHNLDPEMEICKHETMNCLHFGKLGRYIVKHGMGKEISREQTLEILKNAADAGLVHGISNYKQGMDTICNCCPCCCLFLENIKMLPPIPIGHQRSNYIVRHNADTCKTCGLCVKRCPMGALELKDKTDIPDADDSPKLKPRDLKEIAYDPERCIGCGVCAHKCPTQSLTLIRRSERDENIPDNPSDAGKRFLTERKRNFSKIF